MELSEADLLDDPIAMFAGWFQSAVAHGVPEPNAMTLATADREGRPSARIVLLKAFDEHGFCFFTNYESRKGDDLSVNPHAAIVLFWQPQERQVRVEGRVVRTTDEESDAYFFSRPIDARLGAWASSQSRPIDGREALELRMEELRRRHGDGDVPRPPHWGGYRLVPDLIEFWQGRVGRLHDRFEYRREGSIWRARRLSP